MTYKNLLSLFAIFILQISPIYSQKGPESICVNTSSEKNLSFFNSIKAQIKVYENDFQSKKSGRGNSSQNILNSIPVKAHIIRHSDGSGGISLAEINEAISNLNAIYAEAYLEFFLCVDVNYIDEDNLCHFKKGDEKTLIETHYVPGLINLYFTDYIENSNEESICGYSDNLGRTDVVVMKNSCVLNDSTLAHELGHYFSLLHTHGNDDSGTSELVDGSNCDTDGDGICDTPADPGLTSKNMDLGCNYVGIATDANGDLYTPDTSNIMSYSKKICRTHFSQQQLARIYAFYMTAKSYLACPSFNANISASLTETCEEFLTVDFESITENATNWQWDVDGDGIVDYMTKKLSHTFETGIYDVTLIVSNKSKTLQKTYRNLIKVGTQTGFFNEDFENFNLMDNPGWTSNDITGNGYNWYSNIGETQSVETGPSFSSNSDGSANRYMYAEASGAEHGDVAEFISPCFNVDYVNSGLEFAYHMYGKNIGELHIDIKTQKGFINDVIPPLRGSQQNKQSDPFRTKTIDLFAFAHETIKVRFRAIRGYGWDGDIAIDNVFFQTIYTAVTDDIYKVYPNPVTDNLLYVKNSNPSEVASFTIKNLIGQTFLTGTVNNNYPIDISHLSSGSYLLSITNGKSTVVKRFIK
ncbi:T9SS type A sorting domain-containing protein [Flavobacteriaceae bacterium SZ-1-7]|uniref:T9SS type A sorting domain-containing protein n=1 Tax=Tamlana sedimenti TaxID=3134126 RepID=UPI003124A3D0